MPEVVEALSMWDGNLYALCYAKTDKAALMEVGSIHDGKMNMCIF